MPSRDGCGRAPRPPHARPVRTSRPDRHSAPWHHHDLKETPTRSVRLLSALIGPTARERAIPARCDRSVGCGGCGGFRPTSRSSPSRTRSPVRTAMTKQSAAGVVPVEWVGSPLPQAWDLHGKHVRIMRDGGRVTSRSGQLIRCRRGTSRQRPIRRSSWRGCVSRSRTSRSR